MVTDASLRPCSTGGCVGNEINVYLKVNEWLINSAENDKLFTECSSSAPSHQVLFEALSCHYLSEYWIYCTSKTRDIALESYHIRHLRPSIYVYDISWAILKCRYLVWPKIFLFLAQFCLNKKVPQLLSGVNLSWCGSDKSPHQLFSLKCVLVDVNKNILSLYTVRLFPLCL